MTRQRSRPHHQDCGAALLLAVGFVLMIGTIGGGLAALATSSLDNRNTLEEVRNREYAADGAIETAISQARLQTCESGSGSIVDSTMNSVSIRVDWVSSCRVTPSSDGTDVPQWNVLLSACEQDEATLCAPDMVIIRARLNFEQTGASVTRTYVQSWSVNR